MLTGGKLRLLTGTAASQAHPERQYLMAELVRFGFSVALEQLQDFERTPSIPCSLAHSTDPCSLCRNPYELHMVTAKSLMDTSLRRLSDTDEALVTSRRTSCSITDVVPRRTYKTNSSPFADPGLNDPALLQYTQPLGAFVTPSKRSPRSPMVRFSLVCS